jgi:F-type H+-transporting ATPase subunit b
VELSWSTFILEIINFLVLVWILKRFLYKPVLDVIARRRAGIDKSLDEAQNKLTQAQALENQYQNRLNEWEQEKQVAHDSLRREIETERARLSAALMASLDQEREKARVLDERRMHDSLRRGEEQALQHGAQFAGRLLERVANQELEARLIRMALDDLPQLAGERMEALRAAWNAAQDPVTVTSAFPLDEAQRQQLQTQFAKLLGSSRAPWDYRQDPALGAGLRVRIGPWVLRANLQDELKFFAEMSDGAS